MDPLNQSLNPAMEGKNPPLQTLQTMPESRESLSLAGGYYDAKIWAVMKMMAQTFIDAKAFPQDVQNVPQAMVRLQAGHELGLMPIESLKYIALINGRPSLWGDKAIEMVVSAGHRIEWGKCDDQAATCKITRKDTGACMEATYTMKQAIERGLTAKGGSWKTAPENMLKFKAFHMIAKFIVPDALHGASIAEIEETEMPSLPMAVVNTPNVALANSAVLQAAASSGKLKPLAERVAEKTAVQEEEKKPVIEEKVVVEKPLDEPVYEPIKNQETTVPVIQIETHSPLPPAKPTEGVAAKKMREAAEKAKVSKSPNDF